MRYFKLLLTVIVPLALLAPLQSLADTVYLSDGSVLHGQLQDLQESTLTINTDYAGKIVIRDDYVLGVDTNRPLTITLSNGTQVNGRLAYQVDNSPDAQTIRSAMFGSSSMAFSGISEIRPVGAPSVAQVKARKKIAELEKNPWSGSLALGVAGNAGNSRSRDIDFSAKAKRESVDDRLLLSAQVHKAKKDGSDSEADYLGNARLEHDLSERFFSFGQLQAEKDKFEDISLRVRMDFGAGYYFLDQDDHVFKSSLGLGYEHRSFNSGGHDGDMIATLGYHYMVKIAGWNKFSHDLTIIPNLEAMSHLRIESVLADDLPLGDTDTPWSLRAELRNKYDNHPKPGIKKLDTTYTLSIVRSFQ